MTNQHVIKKTLAVLSVCLAPTLGVLGAKAQPDVSPAVTLEKALACVKDHNDLKASFTLHFRRLDSEWISHRYDAQTGEWTYLEGEIRTLKNDGRRAFENLSIKLGRPGGLVPEDLAETVMDLTWVGRTDKGLVYSFLPASRRGGKPMPPAMLEALDRRLVIDEETGCVTGLSMESTKPYKPGLMTRIDDYDFSYHFAKVPGADVPLLAGFTSRTKGKSFYSGFEEDMEATITDIQILKD